MLLPSYDSKAPGSRWVPVTFLRELTPRSLRYRVLAFSLAMSLFLCFYTVFRHPEYVQYASTSASEFVGLAASTTTSSASPEPTSGLQGTWFVNGTRRANAAVLMLVRNSELEGAVSSVRQFEERFNHNRNYPWVFLNEVPFTDEFKEAISAEIAGPVTFGLIPREHWYQPDWIDEDKASASRADMVASNVIYGGSVSYRNMCRFNSGFFFRHPLLLKYKWYWRVEPGVDFLCNTNYDPFLYMEDNDKVYGFTISLYEWPKTITTLWSTVKEFIDMYPEYISPNNSMKFISENDGETYNMCHFWSNFEIANMEFWRGEAYTKFFDHLESKGGFYYERWGDAPVHSIAAALFARKDQIHFFNDVGYRHPPFTHCPSDFRTRQANNCSCKSWGNFDFNMYSCLRKWQQVLKS